VTTTRPLLWNENGGARGVGAYNRRVGTQCTTLNAAGYWGLTQTCARPAAPVVPAQAWGVSGGVPRQGVTLALKNGWLPENVGSLWYIDSIGIVRGQRRNYSIAVLTRGSTEQQGIATIAGVSAIVWSRAAH